MAEKVRTIKGFDHELKCRGFQFEVGKTYHHDGFVELCREGFHAVNPKADPLKVLNYYPPSENGHQNRYCIVEITVIDEAPDKVVGNEITIVEEISILDIAKMHDERNANREDSTAVANKWNSTAVANEWNSTAVANGEGSTAVANGGNSTAVANEWNSTAVANKWNSTAVANGGNSTAVANGEGSTAVANKWNSTAVANKWNSTAVANGGNSTAVANEWNSTAVANGEGSTAVANGEDSTVVANGDGSVALVTHKNSKVSGKVGSAIIAVERGEWNGNTYPIISIAAAVVDGKKIKADTFYCCKAGKLVEVK